MIKIFLGLLLSISISFVNATPLEIIIVRHADKLDQKLHGPALDPTGYERAVHLAFYILNTYGKPDYLVAANPNDAAGHVASMRELQTIAPLENMLEQQATSTTYNVLDPYAVPEYPKLAQYLLSDPRFNGKVVVVCWDHHTIPKLVNLLGVSVAQPVWPGQDFDSVYVLKFSSNDTVASYQLLHNQYPVKPIADWKHFTA